MCQIPIFSSSPTSLKILTQVTKHRPHCLSASPSCRTSRHVARRKFQKMRPQHRPTRGAAHQNHHSSLRFKAVVTMYHDRFTNCWSISGNRTRRTRPCNSVVRVLLEESCGGRHSTVVCALTIQCWSFGTSIVSNSSSFVRLRGIRRVMPNTI